MASRRGADSLIAQGAVRVNGSPVPPGGMLVDPQLDRIDVRGVPVQPPTGVHAYLVLNKPVGVVTSVRDPQGRTTVVDLVRGEGLPRLFPVGRLDLDTSGLLLLTDDGEFSHLMAHPRHRVGKEYVAVVRGIPGERDLAALRSGIRLEDGTTRPAEADLLGSARGTSEVRVVLREGRNRQVRRMFEALGHPVLALSRTAYGPVRLGRLREGGWRRLRPAELEALLEAARGPVRPDRGEGGPVRGRAG